MKYLNHSSIIQIEVTQACFRMCSHCTRAANLLQNPKHSDLKFIEDALVLLKSWPGIVGCFGGEPMMHPQFEDICLLFSKYRHASKSGLWTSIDIAQSPLKKKIRKTFKVINQNNHTRSIHQPPFIALEEIISDPFVQKKMINACWVHHYWSPIITPQGGYFCEVAATIDYLLGKNLGAPLEENWFNHPILEEQRKLCYKCGMALPTLRYDAQEKTNYFSINMLGELKKNSELDLKDSKSLAELSEMSSDGKRLSVWKINTYLMSRKGFLFKSPISQKLFFYKMKLRFFIKKLFLRKTAL